MSRIGKMPIVIPEKVKVEIKEGKCAVTGPLGNLHLAIDPHVELSVVEGKIVVKKKEGSEVDARHGLVRNLVWNMVEGVTKGFKKELDITGVGYRAEVKGTTLVLSLGFSHPVDFPIPTGIKIAVEKQTHLVISGASKQGVGEVAAQIRKLKKTEPYKGKGIKYIDEVIIRKVGKAAVASGGGGGK